MCFSHFSNSGGFLLKDFVVMQNLKLVIEGFPPVGGDVNSSACRSWTTYVDFRKILVTCAALVVGSGGGGRFLTLVGCHMNATARELSASGI